MQNSAPFKRLFAHLLDGFINLVLIICLWILSESFFIAFFLGGLLYSLIQIIAWSKGTFIGKTLFGMQVVKKDTNEPLGFLLMFVREVIGKYISGLLLSLGFIWILIDSDNQGFHDKLVGSVVVDK